MSLYWISWYQPTDDERPLNYPPNDAVLGWWNSGSRCSDCAHTLCAWVSAPDEETAKSAVQRDWPEAVEWRFCEKRDRIDSGDRFRPTNWMIPRMDAYTNQEVSRG